MEAESLGLQSDFDVGLAAGGGGAGGSHRAILEKVKKAKADLRIAANKRCKRST